jgi:bilirubin oxidase
MLEELLMGLAERADVIVDFTNVPVGTEIFLINEGPDEPFAGGLPYEEFEPSDPLTTGQVMKFTVVRRKKHDHSLPVDQLTLPAFTPLASAIRTRKVSLNEESSAVLDGVGPRAAILGTVDESGFPVPLMWSDPITENPGLGDTEIWEIYNFTADAHPIHLHEVQFQVVNREPLVTNEEGITVAPVASAGPATDPEPWETGYKDSVIAYPGQVTRIKATFDLPGRFVWHCHIVEHEDNEMMRPYQVGP